MDEILLKQLVRQMKILNFWVSVFGTLFLVTLAICGVLIWKMVTYVHSTEQKLSDLQAKTSQALDVQNQLCSGSAANLLKNYTDACK